MGTLTSVAESIDEWVEQLSLVVRGGQRLAVDSSDVVGVLDDADGARRAFEQGSPVSWTSLSIQDTTVADEDDDPTDRFGEMVAESERLAAELGFRSLYYNVGALDVDDDERLPLFVAPVRATSLGAKRRDWHLVLEGPLRPSPIVGRLLRDDWGIDLVEPHRTITGTRRTCERIAQELSRLNGPAVVLASFFSTQSGARMGALRDLESFTDIAGSTLVRAMTRDPEACAELRHGEPDSGELIPTVLPADTSQMAVVRQAVAGRSVVVEGPPGCGKSQTIANLLAALVATGRTALLVVEKPTAANVIVGRLREVGLDRMVFDAHDPARPFSAGDVGVPDPPAATGTPHELEEMTSAVEERHFRAMQRIAPGVLTLLKAGDGPAAAISAETALALLPYATEIAQAVRAGRAALDASAAHGVTTDARALVVLGHQLADDPLRLDAVRHLEPSLRDLQSMGPYLAQASGLRRNVRSAMTTATFRRLDASQRRQAFVGAYSRPTLIDDLLRRTGRLLDLAVEARIIENGTTVDDALHRLEQLDRDDVAMLPLPLLDALDRCLVDGAPLTTAAAHVAVPAVQVVRREVGRLTSSDLDHLDHLADLGMLGPLIEAPDPSEALHAAEARSVLRSTEIADATRLERERGRLVHAVAANQGVVRRGVLYALTVGAEARPTTDEQEIELAGLVRAARRDRISVGRVLRTATDAVVRRRPVVLANPWSLGQALPAAVENFDVVVFDEASQIETAAAIPALARSRAAVLFGDSRQLPPTRFFRRRGPEIDDILRAQESALDAFGTLLGGSDALLNLRWHYRSVDDGLITFVNSRPYLYDGSITTTPPPTRSADALRLERYHDAPELAVGRVLEQRTDRGSVAVLTMGIGLADRIDRHLRSHPDIVGDRRVDVRNLERFQGEERDEVVLVLETPDGVSPLQSLGPVNLAGGERRLNVALTRARERMSILSPFGSAELGAARSQGAIMLRDFLALLEHGDRPRPIGDERSATPPAPIAAELGLQLRAAGLDVEVRTTRSPAGVQLAMRVGDRWCALDFDVPELATIDAFDRSVVRPSELERRGWRVERLTIASWLDNPSSVMRRLRQIREEMEHGGR